VLRLLTFPKPTVAMVGGHAVAGGALSRVAFEIVRLRLLHARAGELLLGAALYPTSQAVRLGIVDERIATDRSRDTVLRRAAQDRQRPVPRR